MSLEMMTRIFSDFKFVEKLGSGTRGDVFLVEKGSTRCALKVIPIRDDQNEQEEILFNRESSALAKINSTGIPQVFEFGKKEKYFFLLMEFVDAKPASVRFADSILTSDEGIDLMIQAASTLSDIHKAGLAHRDLNLENVLINGKNELKIIDFGLAAEVGLEPSEDADGAIVGSFHFAAPEQLKTIAKSVDGRSDLFSLGVIFYKLLAGHFPFPGEKIEEVIENQKTKPVSSISTYQTGVSPGIEKIILKLLSIDPAKRYQSSQGLLADLRKLAKVRSASGLEESFPLGEFDLSFRNQMDVPFIGRATELKILNDHLQKAIKGHGRSYLISGTSGVGKSRLVSEIYKTPEISWDFKVRSKCGFQDLLVPYSAIRKLFEKFADHLSQKSDEEKMLLISRLREAAKDCESSIGIVSPSLAKILGFPSSGRDSMDESLISIQISTFFWRLSQLGRGLLLVIDDIQWIDPASLKIVKDIFSNIESHPLFILFTARSESEYQESIKHFSGQMRSEVLFSIELQPLNENGVGSLIQEHLGKKPVSPQVASALYQHSKGNPFVIIETVSSLVTEGFLNMQDGMWKLSEGFHKHFQYNKTVFDLLNKKIGALSSAAKSALSIMGVFGPSIKISLLSKLLMMPEEDVNDAIRIITSVHLTEIMDEGTLAFVHDKVREAILASLSTDDTKSIHLRIWRVLIEDPALVETPEYEIANHSFEALPLIEKEEAFRFQVAAGQVASRNFARKAAYSFFVRARSIEPESREFQKLKFEFYSEFGFVCMEIGNWREAQPLLEKAMSYAKSKEDKVLVLNHQAGLLMQQGDAIAARDVSVQIFSILGEPTPRFVMSYLIRALMTFLFVHFLRAKDSLPAKGSRTDEILLQVYSRLAVIATFLGKKPEALYFVVRQFYFAKRIGPGLELIKAYGFMSMLFPLFGMRGMMKKYHSKALQLAEAIQSPGGRVYTEMTKAISLERMGMSRESEKAYLEVLPFSELTLSNLDFTLCWIDFAWACVARGKIIEVFNLVEKFYPKTIEYGRVTAIQSVRIAAYLSYLLLGKESHLRKVEPDLLENFEKFPEEYVLISSKKYGVRLVRSFETNEISEKVVQDMEKFKSFEFDLNQNMIYYVYLGYIRIELTRQAQKANAAQFAQAQEDLEKDLQELKKYLKAPVFYCHLLVQKAASLRIKSDLEGALKLLDEAERIARESGSLFAIFMAMREKAFIYRDQGLADSYRFYVEGAATLASTNGWSTRLNRLKCEFPDEFKNNPSAEPEKNQPKQDFSEALLRVTLASSFEVDPQRQIVLALDEIIKIMNSERSFIFLREGKSSQLVFAAGRSNQQENLGEPKGYSSTVINKVVETLQPLAVVGSDEMEALGAQSAMAHGLRTVLAAPLIFKNEFIGVIYLDSSIRKGVYSNSDLQLLSALASQVAISFENLKTLKNEAQRREMQKDLELSATVQKMLFPKDRMVQTEFFTLEGHNQPAVQCGGDWWWYQFQPQTQKLRIFLGDVTGHGAGPAMITSYLSSCFQNYMSFSGKFEYDQLLNHLNRMIHQLTGGEFTISAISVEIDFFEKTMTIWNNGFHGLYLFKASGEKLTLGQPGTYIGVDSFQVHPITEKIDSNDQIFITSDGLLEMEMKDGDIFGERRTLRLVGKYLSDPSVERKLDKIKEEIQERSSTLSDDVTMVYLKFN